MDQVAPHRLIHTNEQSEIISAKGDLCIQSFAGTGKSSTLLGYAKKNEREHILYSCFNRSNKLGFSTNCQQQGIKNVQIETLHSLAKKSIYGNKQIKLCGSYPFHFLNGFFANDVSSLPEEDVTVVFYHTLKLIGTFCNSLENKIQVFDYSKKVPIDQVQFVNRYYDLIAGLAIDLMKKMHDHEIPVVHDFYLKLFQIKRRQLPYDTIMLDEAQDCTPVMVDIINNQRSKKIFAGDLHQQIYSWKGASFSFEKINWPIYPLTQSFRLGPSVAKKAEEVLKWKRKMGLQDSPDEIKISGCGPGEFVTGHAIISRSIVGLLKRCFEFMQSNPNSIFSFQGGFDGYLRNDQGVSLMDVFSLYYDDRESIKGEVAKSFETFDALEDFAESTEDYSIKGFIELVESYKTDIPDFIKRVDSISKVTTPSEVIFSTAHRSKGLEYEEVELEDDFFSFNELHKAIKSSMMTPEEVIEEINILYVSITRASGTLIFSDDLLL